MASGPDKVELNTRRQAQTHTRPTAPVPGLPIPSAQALSRIAVLVFVLLLLLLSYLLNCMTVQILIVMDSIFGKRMPE